ncbi:hypothetical protein LC612_24020 [Nostoc sp. CHAB 5834]|nr:hypothetical protein [Nostoc sp. CHAB 5834]
MLTNLNQLIDTPWKVALVAGIGGISLGLLFSGKFTGFDFSNQPERTSLRLVGDQQLLEEINIDGDWVYEAEVNTKDTVFFEDGCRKRLGTVHINQTYSVSINFAGERKKLENCENISNKVTPFQQKDVMWNSLSATISPLNKKVFLSFQTHDDVQNQGYMTLDIIKNDNNRKPDEMKGTMDYLYFNQKTKQWFTANIRFYKSGSTKAKEIEKKI